MATLNDLLQDMVNKDYDELVAVGKTSLACILPAVKAIDAENNGYVLLTSIVLSAIGADGKITALEHKWLQDVLGLDNKAIDTLLSLYNRKTEDMTDVLFDNSPDEFKAHLMAFIVSIMAVDETISREETAFLAKLLA